MQFGEGKMALVPPMLVKRGRLCLKIDWEGPYTRKAVIERFADGGRAPEFAGKDYGLYQVYGRHILAGEGTLLYVGKAAKQTFARHLLQHERWPHSEKVAGDRVYLGRIQAIRRRHSSKDNWKKLEDDIQLAEQIMIRKYSPNYNSSHIAREPKMSYARVVLLHRRDKRSLDSRDEAPRDTRTCAAVQQVGVAPVGRPRTAARR